MAFRKEKMILETPFKAATGMIASLVKSGGNFAEKPEKGRVFKPILLPESHI